MIRKGEIAIAKTIKAIWAQDKFGLIGKKGQLPWKIPEELQHFKVTTMGQVVVMGRVTFDGMGRRVLPQRISIILTRDTSYQVNHPDVLVFHSPEAVLDWYQKQDKDLYVIGGREVFESFADHLEELVVTEVEGDYQGDTFFPDSFDWTAFEEINTTTFPEVSTPFVVHYYRRFP